MCPEIETLSIEHHVSSNTFVFCKGNRFQKLFSSAQQTKATLPLKMNCNQSVIKTSLKINKERKWNGDLGEGIPFSKMLPLKRPSPQS